MADGPARGADVRIYGEAAALHEAAAELIIRRAAAAMASAGRFGIALAGGSTPRALYERLASPGCRDRVDWPRVHLFWGDERMVPPDHPESNFRMVREALIDRVPVEPDHVHRIRGEDPPQVAADDYEFTLRAALRDDRTVGRWLDIDVVLLGLGSDGHTASLFPDRVAAHDSDRWVVADDVDGRGHWRVSLTPALINGAACVAFLVAGADKATAVAAVLDGPDQPHVLPAQLIAPVHGELVWMVDEAAAARLQPRSSERSR